MRTFIIPAALSVLACASGPSNDELLTLAKDKFGTNEKAAAITFRILQNSKAQNCGVPDKADDWALQHTLIIVDTKPESWYPEEFRGKEVVDRIADAVDGAEDCLVEAGLLARLDYQVKAYGCTQQEWIETKGAGRTIPVEVWQPQWATMARARFAQAPLVTGTGLVKTAALDELRAGGTSATPALGPATYIAWRETIDSVVASEAVDELGHKGHRAKFTTKWEATALGKCLMAGPLLPTEVEYGFEEQYGKWVLVH